MRVVAKFQFTVLSVGDEVMAKVDAVLDKWSGRKFKAAADGGTIIRHSGASAAFDRTEESFDDQRRKTFVVLEPVDGGSLQTEIDVVATAERTSLRCVLAVGSDGGIAPADVTLRAPRFVREIIASGPAWTTGRTGERVFAHAFPVDVDDVPELEELMVAPERRLPIIVVSEFHGETLAGDLHERLSQDLCGLAHTVRLSNEASWVLTRSRGKEWSCYNGAVRLFWPFRFNSADFRVHPLWTSDQILARGDDEVQARERFRGMIARRILEASTFAADDPTFRGFETAKARRVTERAEAAAASDEGLMRKLADAYAAENDALRAQVADQEKELELLRDNVQALSISRPASPIEVVEAPVETPPQTVLEAVTLARREFADNIVMVDEIEDDVADLNEAAGPPDKILRYLRTLASLAEALGAGPLGKSVPIWLRENGVDCSGDSDTAKAQDDAGRLRNRLVGGERVDYEFHAKPSEAVSPDKCVRIYFATSTSSPFVKIGYLGRHFD
jgi:hypothetical protein